MRLKGMVVALCVSVVSLTLVSENFLIKLCSLVSTKSTTRFSITLRSQTKFRLVKNLEFRLIMKKEKHSRFALVTLSRHRRTIVRVSVKGLCKEVMALVYSAKSFSKLKKERCEASKKTN